jgi:tetratricopeptide (TPR) repeat protein
VDDVKRLRVFHRHEVKSNPVLCRGLDDFLLVMLYAQNHSMNKTNLTLTLRCLAICGALAILPLAVSAPALAQTAKPKPSPTPRRALPKPVAGTRGFEQFAKRDASARLSAAAATRVIVDPGDHFARGEAHYKGQQYEPAVKELREAIKQSPDWEDPHYVLALSLTELGRPEEAIAEFKQVIAFALKDEAKILPYYNMGNAYADLGKYEDAIKAYQQAIQLNLKLPGRPRASPHNNLGLALAALNRIEEAADEFNIAVKLLPDYAEAHFNLGVAYVQLGRKPDAEAQQKILSKLKPELAAKLGGLIGK